MATRTTVALEDDLDGGPAHETVHFQFGAHEYEIDLNEANAIRFRAQMAPFVSHARKAARGRSRSGGSPSVRRHGADVRAWAREHGIQVSDRGRIPASVLRQFEAGSAPNP